MSAALWSVGTSDAFSTTLNGSITNSSTSIVLTTATGIQAPGVIVVDRVDANGTATSTVREYISYTGIATNTLTGCTRALGGSVAQAHSSGAVVEETWSITHWNDFISAYKVSHDTSGNIVTTSQATMTNLFLNGTYQMASGASAIGTPLHPTWVITGSVSLATTGIGQPLSMPQGGLFNFFSATLQFPASGASLVLDINKNGTSIIQDSKVLTIPGGGTYVSTASINTKTFNAGDVFTVDIDNGGGLAQNLSVTGRSIGS